MPKIYFGLGTNLGNKEDNLLQAVELINKQIGRIGSLSAFYATEPWGFSSENTFLNAACMAETALEPMEVLHLTQDIEKELGRKQKSVKGMYTDRPIDIDILLYDNIVMQTAELTIPHPLMHERLFVMDPLAEIAPDYQHPLLKQTLQELCTEIHNLMLKSDESNTP